MLTCNNFFPDSWWIVNHNWFCSDSLQHWRTIWNINVQIWKYLIRLVLAIEVKRRTLDIIQSALFLMILWRQAKERCWNVSAENRGTEYLRELTTRTSLYKHFLSSPQCIFCSSYCIRSINKFWYAINQPQIKSFCLFFIFYL